MKHFFFAVALAVGMASPAASQGLHPPTKEGFGAKADSPETLREQKPDASRPEAQGGANSQQNLEYGKEKQPEGKSLNEGQPPKP